MKYILHKHGLFPNPHKYPDETKYYLEWGGEIVIVNEDGTRERTEISGEEAQEAIDDGDWVAVDERPEFNV